MAVRLLPLAFVAAILAAGCQRAQPIARQDDPPPAAPSAPTGDADGEDAADQPGSTPPAAADETIAETDDQANAGDPPSHDAEAAESEQIPSSTPAANDEDKPKPTAADPAEENESPADSIDQAEPSSPAADVTPQADEADAAEQLPKERFLLLTRDGPLVIDVVMTIDDEPYHRALEKVVDQAYAEADMDGDGLATWEETIDNPRFAYGQFGNLTPDDESQRGQLIQMYDNNRNGLVDRDELPRFLTRNAGGSRPFSLSSSNEFRGDNRSRSPVRRLLDDDRDGAITAAEKAAAAVRLLNRDADDDEILVLSDFKDNAGVEQPRQMSNRRRIDAPDTAIWFTPRLRWSYVAYALGETYAYGDRVGVADMPLTPWLVEQLDQNNNTLIDNQEVTQLADVPAHLEIEVAFYNRRDSAEESFPRIRLRSVCDQLASIRDSLRENPTRLSLDLPGAEIEFFVNDDPGLLNSNEFVSNRFMTLDADSNGYLDEEEFPGRILNFEVEFAGIDANGDGMIDEQELLTFLDQRQAVQRAQIRARAADQEDALFTALDTNGDGRLTAREIYSVAEVLTALDANGDELLQSHEIPGTLAVGFVRGNPQNTALFNTPAIPPVADEKLPAWFRGMDSNSDGDISPREFLGDAQQFAELDADDDGFISSSEVPLEVEDKAPAEEADTREAAAPDSDRPDSDAPKEAADQTDEDSAAESSVATPAATGDSEAAN